MFKLCSMLLLFWYMVHFGIGAAEGVLTQGMVLTVGVFLVVPFSG